MKTPVSRRQRGMLYLPYTENHDHSYHPAGLQGLRIDAESKRNRALAGGQWHLYRIEHATHRLVDGRVEDKPGRWHVPFTFFWHLREPGLVLDLEEHIQAAACAGPAQERFCARGRTRSVHAG